MRGPTSCSEATAGTCCSRATADSDACLACGQKVDRLSRERLEGVIARQQAQLRKRYGPHAQFQFRVAVEQGKPKLKAKKL